MEWSAWPNPPHGEPGTPTCSDFGAQALSHHPRGQALPWPWPWPSTEPTELEKSREDRASRPPGSDLSSLGSPSSFPSVRGAMCGNGRGSGSGVRPLRRGGQATHAHPPPRGPLAYRASLHQEPVRGRLFQRKVREKALSETKGRSLRSKAVACKGSGRDPGLNQ